MSIMQSTDFRSTVEPILNKIFDGIYNQRAEEYKMIFSVEKGIDRSYHEVPVYFNFNAAPYIPDGEPVQYQAGGTMYNQRLVYRVYGMAFAITKVLVEDGEHINIGKVFAEAMPQALIETKETLGANILNNSFNNAFPGGDGVSLINASHPKVQGTYSNQLTTAAALSQTSLEQMLIQIRQAVDFNGKKINLRPVKLVTSPSNIFQSEVLIKSVLRASVANNDINPVKSTRMLTEQANLTRLTSNTAWWVTTDAPQGLKLFTRRPVEKSMEGDFDTDTMRYKATERYVFGWIDPKGCYGTPGI